MYHAVPTAVGGVDVMAPNGALVTGFDVIDEQSLRRVLDALNRGQGDWQISPRYPSGVYRLRSPTISFFLTCKNLEEAATLRFHLNRRIP